MPRANRHYLPGHIWHITYLCSSQFQWFDRSRSLTAGFLDGLQFRARSRNHHERLGLPLVPSTKLRTGSELIKGCVPFKTFSDKRRFQTSRVSMVSIVSSI